MRMPDFFRDWLASLDGWTFFVLLGLLMMGCVMSFSVSPEVAVRLNLTPYFLSTKHIIFAAAAFVILLGCSFLDERLVKRLSLYLLILSLLMLFFVVFWGESFNGSNRWLRVGRLTVQPSEIAKPAFAIVTAWLLSLQNRGVPVPGISLIWVIYLLLLSLLLIQPDIGQSIFVTLIFLVQWFVAGMPLMFLLLWVSVILAGLMIFYIVFPHVTDRVQSFLSGADQFSQVNLSLRAFNEGGFLGEGLGGGNLKTYLFDAQSDFIFAVLGEELGIFACMLVLGCYAFVVLRGVLRALEHQDLFKMLALLGLLTQFAAQVWVNIGSVTGVIPPKGTVLPFISSGGTAMLSMGFAMGVVLALGRRTPSHESGHDWAAVRV